MSELKISKKTKKKQKRPGRFSLPLDFQKVDWDKTGKIFIQERDSFLNRMKHEKVLNPQTKEILKILAGGAVIGLSFVFPALPMAIAPFVIDSQKIEKKHFQQRLDRLKRQKLVEVVEEDNATLVRITEQGRVRALRYKLDEMKVKKPKTWDRKWRIVIFDIPQRQKRMRDIFRDHLKKMGFYRLQKSVWVHAYPCFDEIEFLRQVYNVGINVTYIVADRFEGTDDLKVRFELE